MKKCTKCNIEKPFSEFRVRKDRPVPFYPSCKQCERNYKKKWYYKNKEAASDYQKEYRDDGHYSVYFLPKENYVGQTKAVKPRMYTHRYNGKDTSDYQILHTFSTKKEALAKEKEYHDKGYRG